ncbi:MAG: dihydroxyacetone kinase subunit DhaK [Opitutales bacterium]|nr:dihydroxyacetone kinase subunit DhaK [Opitutales bacterium]MCH2613925.1 dihydroxyacetone kinase subunit DhaK [Opitutales bacterium]|tara:strand:- start:1742 stop:2743 length:1002 start_codon:yes stop_codon:yes gene_type:complete
MKKLLNEPLQAASELVDGLVDYYNGSVEQVSPGAIALTEISDDKVALLVGGGTGHEPIYHGLIGEGMADGAACGDIFAAPPPNVILDATKAVNRGNGVLYLYGNYAGDVMNFKIAAQLAAVEGIRVETVLIWDDVASAPPTEKDKRRGIAGLIPIVKLAGAAADRAENLDELVALVTNARDNTRSVGVAMAPGSIPATGKPTFQLDEDSIGVGMGIHGEQGVGVEKMTSADELAIKMIDLVLADDLPIGAGDEVLVFINSLGSTTMMECLIVLKKVKALLLKKGISIYDILLGPLVTCQEMAGISLSLTKLNDTLKPLWDAPCSSLGYTKLGK